MTFQHIPHVEAPLDLSPYNLVVEEAEAIAVSYFRCEAQIAFFKFGQ
jgi:hypothetical protein